ncbi:DNA methyltransferase, partial [Maribacter sp.]|uniref:DNA methyltransferase n=1 Tax=Maribacter sp. TaxID=1897614 RepID=UPI0025B93288
GRIYFGKDSNAQPNLIRYIDEIDGFVPWTWLPSQDVGHTDSAMKEFFEIMGKDAAFETPKPSSLIKHLMQIVLKKNDIVLDFFSGTSTTATALMDLNFENKTSNKFLNVQLDQMIDDSPRFNTIADISKERIRRTGEKVQEKIQEKIKKFKSEVKRLQGELPTDETKSKIEQLKSKIEQLKNQDLGFKVLKLSDSNFKQWQQITGKDSKALEEQMKLFIDPVAKNATTENMVYELLLKSGKDLNSQIEEKDGFYSINKNELVFLLEQVNQKIIDTIIASKPKKIIALDKLFKGNDQLKTNAVLQMKDSGIEFKTI